MSVTAPRGFVATGVSCGIKASGSRDLALVATEDRAAVTAAGVFTSNRATAAPVVVCRQHLETTGGRAAAVVLNSGNANAATGAQGQKDAESMCATAAEALGCAPAEVLVCSTGLIGFPLPMEAVVAGVRAAAADLAASDAGAAAEAIMTTDTRRKEAVASDGGVTVGGMAKGAAMLAPDMATMLAVLTTDAAIEPASLRRALQRAAAGTFNALTVDGCTSTNDTVLVLASGRAGPVETDRLGELLADVCGDLAGQMAADAEGATKVVRVVVRGATSDGEAWRAARAVADSVLVKCSLYGGDPYWGRVVSELGASGAAFDPDRVAIAYGGEIVCANGVGLDHDAERVRGHLAGRHVEVSADLGLGVGQAAVLTTDLTHAYIDENMRTS